MFGCVGGDIAHLHRNVDHDFGLAGPTIGAESYPDHSRRTLATAGGFPSAGSAPVWLEAGAKTISPRLRLCELVVAGGPCGWTRGGLRRWKRQFPISYRQHHCGV